MIWFSINKWFVACVKKTGWLLKTDCTVKGLLYNTDSLTAELLEKVTGIKLCQS